MPTLRETARSLRKVAQQIDAFERKSPLAAFRRMCIADSGRLTNDGKDFLRWAQNRQITQRALADLLQVTPSAVSNFYNR